MVLEATEWFVHDTPNKWFFVSLTRNDSGGQLYIDGQRSGSIFSAGTSYPFLSSSAL